MALSNFPGAADVWQRRNPPPGTIVIDREGLVRHFENRLKFPRISAHRCSPFCQSVVTPAPSGEQLVRPSTSVSSFRHIPQVRAGAQNETPEEGKRKGLFLLRTTESPRL